MLAVQPLLQRTERGPATRFLPRLFCHDCFGVLIADQFVEGTLIADGSTVRWSVRNIMDGHTEFDRICSTFEGGMRGTAPMSASHLFADFELEGRLSAVEKDFQNFMQGLIDQASLTLRECER